MAIIDYSAVLAVIYFHYITIAINNNIEQHDQKDSNVMQYLLFLSLCDYSDLLSFHFILIRCCNVDNNTFHHRNNSANIIVLVVGIIVVAKYFIIW